MRTSLRDLNSSTQSGDPIRASNDPFCARLIGAASPARPAPTMLSGGIEGQLNYFDFYKDGAKLFSKSYCHKLDGESDLCR